MKIKPEHYAEIKRGVEEAFSQIQLQRLNKFYKKSKLLSPTRLRWDIFRSAFKSNYITDNPYPYLNDDHIDTALRNIIKELGADYGARKE